MKVVFFGTPQFVVPILDVLNQKYEVVAVVTAPDKKVGRHHVLTPTPVKQFALNNNIPVFTPENLFSFDSQLSTLNSQLFVVAAYGKIIPKAILDIPQFGTLNIHPSALPKYRGPSPITNTILNGDKTSAISFMHLDEKMDHGPIITAVPYDIPDDATNESLTTDMFQKSAELLPEVIDDYVAGKLKPVPQNHDKATYTKIITKQDGYIDLSSLEKLNELEIKNLKLEIARKIQAYYPWPTVWSKLKTKNGELKTIKLLPNISSLRGASKTSDATISSPFLIQMEGKNPVNLKDFLNGYPEMRDMLAKIF